MPKINQMLYPIFGELLAYAHTQENDYSANFFKALLQLITLLNKVMEAHGGEHAAPNKLMDCMRAKLVHDCLAVTPLLLKAFIQEINEKELEAGSFVIPSTPLYQTLYPKEDGQHERVYFARSRAAAKSPGLKGKDITVQKEALDFWYATHLLKVCDFLRLQIYSEPLPAETMCGVAILSEILLQLKAGSSSLMKGDTAVSLGKTFRNTIFHDPHCNVTIPQETWYILLPEIILLKTNLSTQLRRLSAYEIFRAELFSHSPPDRRTMRGKEMIPSPPLEAASAAIMPAAAASLDLIDQALEQEKRKKEEENQEIAKRKLEVFKKFGPPHDPAKKRHKAEVEAAACSPTFSYPNASAAASSSSPVSLSLLFPAVEPNPSEISSSPPAVPERPTSPAPPPKRGG